MQGLTVQQFLTQCTRLSKKIPTLSETTLFETSVIVYEVQKISKIYTIVNKTTLFETNVID